jgi:hypothetical protein
MSHAESKEQLTSFSESDARRILGRAAEIDAKDGVRIGAAELRGIAASAAIEKNAIERALGEFAAEVDSRIRGPVTEGSRWKDLARGLSFITVGGALGAVAVTVDGRPLGSELAAAVFGPSAAFVLYRALWNRWHGSPADFLRESILTMGTFTLVITVLAGYHATMPGITWAAICSVAGSIVAGVSFRWTSPAAPQPSGGNDRDLRTEASKGGA